MRELKASEIEIVHGGGGWFSTIVIGGAAVIGGLAALAAAPIIATGALATLAVIGGVAGVTGGLMTIGEGARKYRDSQREMVEACFADYYSYY